MEPVSVIIPAYNEEERILETLSTLQGKEWIHQIIVVDDGSSDQTVAIAKQFTPFVYQHASNQGKAEAMLTGASKAESSILLFLDADLGKSAAKAKELITPLWQDHADMTVASFPPALNSGFGIVKRLAILAIYLQTGKKLTAPLSGQRAIKKELFKSSYRGDHGFGIEVGLSIDFIKAGHRLLEIPIAFSHREMGKTFKGFLHRMKQGVAVCQSLLSRR